MPERLVRDYALERHAWIVKNRLAVRDENDLNRPIEHPTKFVTDPSRSPLVGRPPFRWHPQAAFAVAFDDITEHDDALIGESEYRFAPPSLRVFEHRDLDAIRKRLARLPNIPLVAFGNFIRRTPVPCAREQDAYRQVNDPLPVATSTRQN